MNSPSSTGRAAWSWVAAAMAWSAYSTLSLQYLAFCLALAMAGVAAARARPADEAPNPEPVRTLGVALPWVLLWAWLSSTALWSPASAWQMLSHLWPFTLVLLAAGIARACPASAGDGGLRHFVWASAVAALLNLAARSGALPELPLWARVVDAQGNQRIATSIWLALGTVLALHAAADPAARSARERSAFGAATLLCLVALATQDRRSGMVLLMPLLGAWALRRLPTARGRWIAIAALGLAAVTAWHFAPGARARFAEGIAELRAQRTPDTVATSWGQRMYMLEITAALVAERPLTGHGLGSWPRLWQSRTPAGSELHEHSTPHNEYLLAATQGGIPAAVLLVAGVLLLVRAGWRAGPSGAPLMVIALCIGLAGLFNAALRDAKFELVLLMLAAMAWSSHRALTSCE